MKSIALLPAVVMGLLVLGGCESSPDSPAKASTARPAVMDLDDSPPATIPPAASRVDAPPATVAPAPPPPIEAATGRRKHVIAAKDTVYSLSRTYYGDPNQWKKIVAANPGLVPEKMPIGKTIVIP